MNWFEKYRRFSGAALATLLWLTVIAPCVGAERGVAVPDFTFIQASDVHAPMPQSQATISLIPGVGEVNLAPFEHQGPEAQLRRSRPAI